MNDKEMFINLLSNLGIKCTGNSNYNPNCIVIDSSETDDWDLEEYVTILIEFDINNKYSQFKLVKGISKEWENNYES